MRHRFDGPEIPAPGSATVVPVEAVLPVRTRLFSPYGDDLIYSWR